MNSFNKTLIVLLGLTFVFDLVSTFVGLHYVPGAYETNAISAYIISLGWGWLILKDIIKFGIFYFIIWLNKDERAKSIVLIFAILFQIYWLSDNIKIFMRWLI